MFLGDRVVNFIKFRWFGGSKITIIEITISSDGKEVFLYSW
jgi:hypothetical protein